MKFHMIDKRERDVYSELKEYTLEELKNYFKPDEELWDDIEKWEDINDIDDLTEYLKWEAEGMEVPYIFEEVYDFDYMVLFGAYDNEHPEDHYRNRKSKGEIYNTIRQARERAWGYSNVKIWEVAHSIDSGDIVFVREVK